MSSRFRRPLARWRGLLLAALLIPASQGIAASAQTSTDLFIDGSRYRAVLAPSPARIGMSDADRQLLRGEHYSGTLEQVPDSWVRLSRLNDRWSGVVSLHGEMHIIDSTTFGQEHNLPVARSLQSLQAPGTCGVGNGTHSSLELPTREGASARSGEYHIAAATLEEMCTDQVDGVCLLPEKYLIVDHLFQQKHPDTYQDKVVELLNIIDGFYRNDLNMVFDNLHVEFPSEELLLESTSANELLVDLREKYHGFSFADTSTASPLMELLSGREFDGSTVGLAYVGTLCNTNGYATGVTQEYVNIPLTAIVMAHEIGHNFGANHDNVEADQVDNPERYCGNGHIMSSFADPSATGFSRCSVTQMTAKVDSLNNQDACFNYPVDAGFSADSANPERFDNSTGTTLALAFTLDYQQASRAPDQIQLQGNLSNARIEQLTLPDGDCSIAPDQRSYSCSLTPPFAPASLTLGIISATPADALLTQTATIIGSEVKDILPGNDQLSTPLTYDIVSSQPNDLQAQVQQASPQVTLTWTDRAFTETGYRVERASNDGSWALLVSLPANSETHIDTGIDTDLNYQYRVIAEGNDITGDSSNVVSIRVEGTPAAPANLTTALAQGGIQLSWNDQADNEQRYEVQRRRDNNGSWTSWTPLVEDLATDSVQYLDSTAVLGERYQYRVIAHNATLASAPSNLAEIQFGSRPEAPSNLTSRLLENALRLTWQDQADNETGFRILRQQFNGQTWSEWQSLVELGSNQTRHDDSSVIAGTLYRYQVQAFNAVGSSPLSNSAEQLFERVPAAPDNLQAQRQNSAVALQWQDNADNEFGFRIERQRQDGDTWLAWQAIAELNANSTRYTDTRVTLGNRYRYRVSSLNSAGPSTPSAMATITLNNEITPTGDDNTFDDSTPPQDFNDDGGSAGFLTGLLALLMLRRRRGTAPC